VCASPRALLTVIIHSQVRRPLLRFNPKYGDHGVMEKVNDVTKNCLLALSQSVCPREVLGSALYYHCESLSRVSEGVCVSTRAFNGYHPLPGASSAFAVQPLIRGPRVHGESK
jgi:hypothetical protein